MWANSNGLSFFFLILAEKKASGSNNNFSKLIRSRQVFIQNA